MGVLALSSTVGSLGDEVGRDLSRRLGYDFADREIIAKAAADLGGTLIEFDHVTDEAPTLWERFGHTKPRYLTAVAAVLFQMAAGDKVTLSGRGSTILLTGIPHVLRVRINAPGETRARRVADRQGCGYESALRFVRTRDRERALRIMFLYHVDWDAPILYDLVLNTARVTAEEGVRILEHMLRLPRYIATAESRQKALDLSIVARVEVGLAADPVTQGIAFTAACENGHVVISGPVPTEAQWSTAEAIVLRIPGVTCVENQIAVAPSTTRENAEAPPARSPRVFPWEL
jgi:cytidylate kinase